MNKLEWVDGMSVGVESIDNDHKKLLSLISRLSNAIEAEKTNDILESIFNELADYVGIHFSREEKLMRDCHYIGYDDHVEQHRQFAEKVPDLRRHLLQSKSTETALEVYFFLYQWLIHHILEDDMSYAQSVYDSGLADGGIAKPGLLSRLTGFITQRLRLGQRILLIGLLPLLALSWLVLSDKYQQYQSIDTLLQLSEIVLPVNQVVHNLQIERGLSFGFVSSDYKRFYDELNQQKKMTDVSITAFLPFLQAINSKEKSKSLAKNNRAIQNFEQLIKQFKQLKLFRQKVQNKTKNVSHIFDFYTLQITRILNVSNQMMQQDVGHSMSRQIMLLNIMIQLKEKLGQERAFGVKAIENRQFSTDDFRFFNELIAQQKLFITNYKQLATLQQNEIIQNFVKTKINKRLKKVETQFITAVESNKLSQLNSQQWFDITTANIEQLKIITDQLALNIQNQARLAADKIIIQFVMIFSLLILTLLLSVFLSWLLTRSILLPVHQITEAMVSLTQGNKGIRFTQNFGHDELGEMVNAYEKTRRALLCFDVASALSFRRLDINLSNEAREKQVYEELASMDPLTNTYNRRKFDEYIEKEFNRSSRYKSQFSLLMLDIDFFKKVNDNYGHQVGDSVLQQFSKTCQKIVRDTDIMARVGGEEFIIIMPETNVYKANNMAERIRKAISTLSIGIDKTVIKITVSIGVTAWNDAKFKRVEDLLETVDKALYQAKENGRNRVVVL